MPTPFETYITNIERDLKGGKATELTYRSAVEIFMESLARQSDQFPEEYV